MAAPTAPQSFANHTRTVPGFHFFTGSLVSALVVWALWRFAAAPGPDTGIVALIAIVSIAEFWYLRAFPIAVQNRLIRLEERLRLEKLVPTDARRLSDKLSARQMVALRFASDEEFPALAKKVADEDITDTKAIKQMVRNWRADHTRA